MNPVAD